jgi:cytochrome P450
LHFKATKLFNIFILFTGEGPRICLGQRFGLLTVKFAIATIIRNFKVTVDDTKIKWPLRIDPKRGGDIDPIGGYWVRFEKNF